MGRDRAAARRPRSRGDGTKANTSSTLCQVAGRFQGAICTDDIEAEATHLAVDEALVLGRPTPFACEARHESRVTERAWLALVPGRRDARSGCFGAYFQPAQQPQMPGGVRPVGLLDGDRNLTGRLTKLVEVVEPRLGHRHTRPRPLPATRQPALSPTPDGASPRARVSTHIDK